MRILIVKLSSLGDLFHALPAVHCLKQHFKAEIHWAVQKEYEVLCKCFTDVNRVIPVDRRSFFPNLRNLASELRQIEYDMVIDMQGLLKSALVARLARGRERIGPSFHREGSALFYNRVAGPRNLERHAVDQIMDVVRMLGAPASRVEFPVRFPDMHVIGRRPRVALLPLSRWVSKNWPPESFVQVAKKIKEKKEGSFFVLGGDGDAEFCGRIQRDIGEGAVSMAGRLSLPALGGFLKQMDLVIANDTGPVHMAVVTGTPTVVIFGPTDPRRTGPYGQKSRVLTAKIECRPCFSRTCRYGMPKCMADVTPGEVAETALKMLR